MQERKSLGERSSEKREILLLLCYIEKVSGLYNIQALGSFLCVSWYNIDWNLKRKEYLYWIWNFTVSLANLIIKERERVFYKEENG